MSRVLVVGDCHEPVAHPGYLDFCKDLKKQWSCDTVVFIGDIVDWHAISFHQKHPDCPGAKDEYALAKIKVQKWYKAFPKASVCIGNHDERVIRLAASVGIPAKFIRNYADVWETPGWKWDYDHQIDNVYYFHGVGCGGIHPAFNQAKKMLMSVVMGHCHTASGIKWLANPNRRIFAMDTGCGIDHKEYQFAYGHHARQKPVLSAGIILDGIPYHEVMPIGHGERYAKENYRKEN